MLPRLTGWGMRMVGRRLFLVGLGCLSAGWVAAHTGVTNMAVMARMDGMVGMADQMEVLVPMLRGAVPFDAVRADQAFRRLAELSAAAPDQFRAPEQDPASEALPIIWEEFAAFEQRFVELQALSEAAVGQATDRASLGSVLGPIGNSCNSCHERYRETDG